MPKKCQKWPKMAKNGVFCRFFTLFLTKSWRWGAKLAGRGNQQAPENFPDFTLFFPCRIWGPHPGKGFPRALFVTFSPQVNKLTFLIKIEGEVSQGSKNSLLVRKKIGSDRKIYIIIISVLDCISLLLDEKKRPN